MASFQVNTSANAAHAVYELRTRNQLRAPWPNVSSSVQSGGFNTSTYQSAPNVFSFAGNSGEFLGFLSLFNPLFGGRFGF